MADPFTVGCTVRALVDMDNDLTDEGFGVQHCASKGDVLIVRRITDSGALAVSHPHITDRAFIAWPHEVEGVPSEGLIP